MSDLDDFMAENTPTFRSKLQPYLSDIQTLWQHGYSEPDILRYLSEKKMLVVTRKTLHAFIVKNIQPKTPTPQTVVEPPKPIIHQKEKAVSPPNASAPENTPSTQTSEVSTEQEKPTPTDKPKLKKGIKKFDWKNATSDGLA